MPGPPVKGGPGIRAECPWRESNPRPSDYMDEGSDEPENVITVDFWPVAPADDLERAA